VFGSKKNYDEIDVEFFEPQAGRPFATTKSPIDQLPDTFEIRTTLHIGDDEWRIVSADPPSKGDFRKTGRLKLVLVKVRTEWIAPRDVLYGLPTISNDIAGLEPASSLENALVVHEDDWRQSEVISSRFTSLMEGEFRAIRLIYEHERAGVGFKNLHIRSAIPEPLAGVELTLDLLRSEFSSAHEYDGVAFDHAAGLIQHGFAFRNPTGLIVWGQTDAQGHPLVVCLKNVNACTLGVSFDAIDAWLDTCHLVWVDWIGALKVSRFDGLATTV